MQYIFQIIIQDNKQGITDSRKKVMLSSDYDIFTQSDVFIIYLFLFYFSEQQYCLIIELLHR